MGPVAKTPFGLYSGSDTTDNVSAIRLLNEEAYLNRIKKRGMEQITHILPSSQMMLLVIINKIGSMELQTEFSSLHIWTRIQ